MTKLTSEMLCKYLDWDSKFFGRHIARLQPTILDQQTVQAALDWCEDQQIECLYFLSEIDHAETVALAEKHSFHLVDLRLTLETRLKTGSPSTMFDTTMVVRPAQSEDVSTLRAIARVGHQDSRFYFDGNFSRALCDELYMTWIEKSCQGYANQVLVAQGDEQAVGYVSCHVRESGYGEIGLVGVSESARGKGVGQQLIHAALAWFVAQGVVQVQVVTQGRNIQAQRLYQRCGFLSQQLQLWYHRWFTTPTV